MKLEIELLRPLRRDSARKRATAKFKFKVKKTLKKLLRFWASLLSSTMI